MKLIWLQSSDIAFGRISEHIAQEHPSAAINFELSVGAILDNLCIFPEAGREGRVAGTREAVVPQFPYIIIYRINGNEVQILRILHKSRQWPVVEESS
jgi:toxin ParE1/3/4